MPIWPWDKKDSGDEIGARSLEDFAPEITRPSEVKQHPNDPEVGVRLTELFREFCSARGFAMDAPPGYISQTWMFEAHKGDAKFLLELDSHDWRFYVSRTCISSGEDVLLETALEKSNTPVPCEVRKTIDIHSPEKCAARMKFLLDLVDSSGFLTNSLP